MQFIAVKFYECIFREYWRLRKCTKQAYVCTMYIKYLISVCCRAEHFFMENNYKIIIMYLIHDEKIF